MAGSWPNKYKVLLRTPGLERISAISPTDSNSPRILKPPDSSGFLFPPSRRRPALHSRHDDPASSSSGSQRERERERETDPARQGTPPPARVKRQVSPKPKAARRVRAAWHLSKPAGRAGRGAASRRWGSAAKKKHIGPDSDGTRTRRGRVSAEEIAGFTWAPARSAPATATFPRRLARSEQSPRRDSPRVVHPTRERRRELGPPTPRRAHDFSGAPRGPAGEAIAPYRGRSLSPDPRAMRPGIASRSHHPFPGSPALIGSRTGGVRAPSGRWMTSWTVTDGWIETGWW